MEVPRIAILICTVMVISLTSIPFVYAQDDSNQSEIIAADEVQVIPLQSVFSLSSGDESNFAQVPSSGSEMQVKSYTLQGSSSVPADMAGIEWQELLGGRGGDGFMDIQPIADGNYITAGATGTPELVPGFSNSIDAWIMKTDPKGTLIWQKVYGSNQYDEAMSIRQTNDVNTIGYVFAGYSNSTLGNFTANHGKEDGWVVKLDKDGNLQWQTLLGGNGSEWLMSVRQIPDNSGYIVAGYTESDNITGSVYKGNTDIFVAKLANNGSVVWQKVIGGDNYDFGSSIIPASDGGYILAGYTRSEKISESNSNHGYNDILIMKLNDAGDVQWSKLLGGCQGEATAFDNIIQQTPDGGYILTGQTLSSLHRCGDDVTGNTHGSADIWVVKLDKRGNIQWQNLLGGTGYDDGGVIHQTSHGDYIIAGRTTSDNSGDIGQNNGPRDSWDAWVAKLDSNGQLLWQDTLGGSGYDQCTAIQPMPDEGFILSVYTMSSDSGNIVTNHGFQDAWLAKLKPRLVVDVEDSNSHSWVPNTTVFLHDVVNKTDRDLTAVINGRVVFTGSDESDQFPLVKGRNYTVRSAADNYYNNSPKEVTFTQDGMLVNLSQQPKYTPTDKTFSITCIENYDYICGNDGICSLSGSYDECDNVASALISAGYNKSFYHKDGEVTEKDFATDSSYAGENITGSAFHYHTGHGTDSVIAGTYLNLKDSNQYWLPGIPPIPVRTGGYVDAGMVAKKWGGKTKWVMLQSCNILKDENWKNALTSSHGILGYSTSTGVNSSFSKVFLNYALDKNKNMTIVSAYKQATLDTWHDDGTIAKVITRTEPQYYTDQFPGVGDMAPDAGPNDNNRFRRQWNCRSGVEW